MTPTVPGTKCRCEGGLEWGGGLFVWFFLFVFLSSQWITHNPTEDLNNAFSPPSSGFSLSSSFSVPPLPHCLAEAAYSYNRAWLEGLATPSPQFQRAELKGGGTGRGAGMPRKDINSAFLSGFRSSHLFSFPLFPSALVRREPALQRGNFLGAWKDLSSSHSSHQHD